MIKSKFPKQLLLLLGIVFLFILFKVLELTLVHQDKMTSITGLSDSSSGVSLFIDWINTQSPESATLTRKPFLKIDEFSSVETLALLSPRSSFSKRETRLLEEFVRKGGKLILSFHSDKTHSVLSPLLTKLGISLPTEEIESFRNGIPQLVNSPSDQWLFKSGEEYAFYSLVKLKNSECIQDSISCFFSQHQIESGTVLVFSGLPFFSNGLLGKSQNAQAAFRLKTWAGKIVFDEYHHFFSDQSWVDFIRKPKLSLPLFGFTVLLFLFFLFGHTPFHERHLRDPTVEDSVSLQSWNERVFFTMLGSSDFQKASQFHGRHLKRVMTRSGFIVELPTSLQVKSRDTLLEEGSKLLSLHRHLLLRRRKGTKS